jgi:hypothetical protein
VRWWIFAFVARKLAASGMSPAGLQHSANPSPAGGGRRRLSHIPDLVYTQPVLPAGPRLTSGSNMKVQPVRVRLYQVATDDLSAW